MSEFRVMASWGFLRELTINFFLKRITSLIITSWRVSLQRARWKSYWTGKRVELSAGICWVPWQNETKCGAPFINATSNISSKRYIGSYNTVKATKEFRAALTDYLTWSPHDLWALNPYKREIFEINFIVVVLLVLAASCSNIQH